MVSDLLQQVSLLSADEQLDLVEAVWNGIGSRNAAPPTAENLKKLSIHQ